MFKRILCENLIIFMFGEKISQKEVSKMEKSFAVLRPQDMKIISEAEKKLCDSTGKCVALVAYDNK